MKNLISYVFAALLCSIVTMSCSKKDSNTPNNADGKVSAADLKSYYLVSLRDDNAMRVVYFVSENGATSVYADGLGARRVFTINSDILNNNTLTLNLGSSIYTYKFSKEASGNVSLDNYNLQSSDGSILINTQLFKVSDAPVFMGRNGNAKIFTYTKSQDGDSVMLYFDDQNGPVWKYDDKHGPSSYMPYYTLANNIGWKSNDDSTFGVAVPGWKGIQSTKMLIQSAVGELQLSGTTALRIF